MELTGKVILDEETMNCLKSEIRKSIIDEIKKDGYEGEELISFLSNKSPESVCDLLKIVIPDILENSDPDRSFQDKHKIKKLEMIKEIISL